MNSESNDMNRWTTTKVFRINGTLVIGRSVEDAIKVYRDFCAPSDVTIESIEMVFGDSTKLDKDAIIADQGAKAAEAIALLTEQNEELRKKYADLESRFAELKKIEQKKEDNSELTPFEVDLFSMMSEAWQGYQLGEEVNIAEIVKEHSSELLERANKQKSGEWNISDFRTWQYIVSDVLTKKDGIGQYLDSSECKKIAQDMQEEWSKKLCSAQHSAAWSEEELDSITAAINNLEYLKNNYVYHQMGLEPAITFLKSLKDRVILQSKQGWSEEDEYNVAFIVETLLGLDGDKEYLSKYKSMANWLKVLKERYTWEPSDEQMNALREAVIEMGKSVSRCSIEEFHEIESLYNDLKKLKQ